MRPPAELCTPGGVSTEMANEMFLKYSQWGKFENRFYGRTEDILRVCSFDALRKCTRCFLITFSNSYTGRCRPRSIYINITSQTAFIN